MAYFRFNTLAILYHPAPRAVIAGSLLTLAFPSAQDHPLQPLFDPRWAYLGLVPLLSALPGGSFARGFGTGWIAGLVFNLGSLYWIAQTQGGGTVVVVGTILMASYLGLYPAVFAGVQNRLAALMGKTATLAAPVLWTALEYLLSLGELGFPWMLLGHSQAPFPRMIQYASITAVYGISFWIVLVNTLLYLILTAAGRLRIGSAIGLPAFLALPWAYGCVVLGNEDTGPTVRVAIIQPNLSLEEKWGADGLDRCLATLDSLSRRAAVAQPDLIVWPETALPCYVRFRPDCRARLAGLSRELQIPVLTGATDFNYDRKEPYNSAFLVDPNSEKLQSYAKIHLVPFGERTPFRDTFPLLHDIDWTALTGDLGPAEFAPGTTHTVFTLPSGPFSVLICFESVFPNLVRQAVAAGSRLLINITNDSWFGLTAGPYQHAQLSVMRAVENRTAIARCANTGISFFVDPYGRVSQRTGLFTRDFRVGDLPTSQTTTFYTRYGDIFAHITVGIAAAVVTISILGPRRSSV